MCIIYRKLTIVCYERAHKKYEFIGEKYNIWQLFVTKERQHIKFIIKIKYVQKNRNLLVD